MVGAVSACVIGRVADRYGAKRVIVGGLVLLALIYMAALLVAPKLPALYVFYGALGIATLSTSPIASGILVSHWFDARRGLALGLMMVGSGVGAMVMPAIVHTLIAHFGWRAAFALCGVAVLVIPLPIAAIFLKEPPGRIIARRDVSPGLRDALPGVAWHAIWRDADFWLMVGAFFVAGAAVHACALHLPQILGDRGVDAKSAALATAITGVAVLVGRLASGAILDRRFGPFVAMAFFSLAALGLVLLAFSASAPAAMAAAFLVGLSFGAEVDLIGFLLSRYFGLRALGTSFGVGFAAFVVAGGFGPFLMGVGFDATGSYRLPLLGFAAAMLLAVALMSRLGAYRFGVVKPVEIPVGTAVFES
jgi:MFS family permease